MRFAVVLLVVWVSTGCQQRKSQCTSAVSGAIDRMVADARGTMPPTVAANIARVVPQMKSAIIASCEHDEWAPNVIECISKAGSREELDACDAMLTPKQRENEHKRNDELLKNAIQPLQKNDPDKSRRDPHEGLGIPPADQLREGTPPAQGSGSAAP
jgi:hypothetical protein